MSSYNQKPLLTVSSAKSILTGSQLPLQALSRGSIGRKLVRYGGPLESALNSKACLQLTIPAKHGVAHYKEYSYFGVHTHKSKQRICRYGSTPYTLSCAHEWLTRDRRCVAFADSSGLKPIRHGRKQQKLRDRVHQCIHTDHLTSWVSESGGEYLLNEPYFFEGDYQQRLQAEGFSVFQLPINISPYCGKWSKDVGSPPASRSFLITSYENGCELDVIWQQVAEAALALPVWNDVSGIRYV